MRLRGDERCVAGVEVKARGVVVRLVVSVVVVMVGDEEARNWVVSEEMAEGFAEVSGGGTYIRGGRRRGAMCYL